MSANCADMDGEIMRRPDEIIDRVQTWGGAIELSTAQNRALLEYIAALEAERDTLQMNPDMAKQFVEAGLRAGGVVLALENLLSRYRQIVMVVTNSIEAADNDPAVMQVMRALREFEELKRGGGDEAREK